MARFLALAFGALWIVAGTAHAQAFKPRGSKPATSAKTTSSDDAESTPAKKAHAKKATAKKATAKKAHVKAAAKASDDDSDGDDDDADDEPAKARKSASSARGSARTRGKKPHEAREPRPDGADEDTSEPSSKHDADHVVITDDDDIE
ncbi:MAG: hypothetical protein ABI591_17120 [Kofleriaceae bacterium]